ncbi:MAG: hypothetical protein JNJ57_19330 [Saprospiraceae bacterium]|nr:hypothetical protein [Saprospiraceae bacterium]
MKNNLLSLAALVLISAAFTSCKKDPTLKDQLVGNWLSVQVTAGSEDLTAANSFDLRLQDSKEFDLDLTTVAPLVGTITQSYSGDWSTDETKQEVTLVYNGTGETKTWDIIEITDTTLTAELVENNIRYTVKFQKQ